MFHLCIEPTIPRKVKLCNQCKKNTKNCYKTKFGFFHYSCYYQFLLNYKVLNLKRYLKKISFPDLNKELQELITLVSQNSTYSRQNLDLDLDNLFFNIDMYSGTDSDFYYESICFLRKENIALLPSQIEYLELRCDKLNLKTQLYRLDLLEKSYSELTKRVDFRRFSWKTYKSKKKEVSVKLSWNLKSFFQNVTEILKKS